MQLLVVDEKKERMTINKSNLQGQKGYVSFEKWKIWKIFGIYGGFNVSGVEINE